jgi:hypothetical protein
MSTVTPTALERGMLLDGAVQPLDGDSLTITNPGTGELGRRPGARLGLATMCIGVGQGIAALIEKTED